MKKMFKKVVGMMLAALVGVGIAGTFDAMEVSAAGLADIFDADYYASQNPDLQAIFGNNKDLLYAHFLQCGLSEGRNMSPVLNVAAYRAANADLDAVFGDNWDAYVDHYLSIGMYEGRDAGISANTATSQTLTDGIHGAMMALQESYPEGMRWTNDNFYAWNGGIYSGGYGCAGFAFMLSDAAFGSQPARIYQDASLVRVGDIVRMNGNTHSVIVLSVHEDGVTVAEGNYNSSIHWGRFISNSELANADYFMTRY